jgi:hypothetical protein
MPKRPYNDAFSFVSPSPTRSFSALTMDPIAPPPVPDPTTPDRPFPRTKRTVTPSRFTTTFAPSSQPVGSTQCALQESLTNNVVFANEAIVHAIFQPSTVDDQAVVDILAEISDDKPLKDARDAVLSGKLAETKKYKSMVRHRILVSERADLNPLD